MTTQTISFNKEGYDPFIDFIKAYAIICVLIGHTVPFIEYAGYGLWAGMQVPLFILIQVFHFYKKDDSKLSIKKLFKRIIIPFLVFGVFTFAILVLSGKEQDAKSLLIRGLRNGGGGYGPGSYYPIIYLQIALLLPVFHVLFKKLSEKNLFWIFLFISEGFEILCSLTHPSVWFYRILAVRYVFLIYLGWLWVKDGIKLDWKMIILSIFSLLSIIYFEYVSVYFEINNEPLFFDTRWTFHRWPCYFFCSTGLIYVLHIIFQKLQKNERINSCIKILAKSSYEIFLVQMTFCYLFKPEHVPFVDNPYLQFAIRFILIWVVSIFGGIMVNKLFNRVFNKKQVCTKKQSAL